MQSDRIFGLVVLFVALAFMASATQIQSSFLADPVGPRAFPLMIGAVAVLSSLVMIFRPDPNPQWPTLPAWTALLVALAVLVGYAFALKPLGFIIPTAIAASVISFQISPRLLSAVLAGCGLSIGLFILFKFILDLGLVAFPSQFTGGG